jgi:hypothetical protein
MMLRRYHNTTPDREPDGEQPTGTTPDLADDAPQDTAPAGRSRTRSKTSKSGG